MLLKSALADNPATNLRFSPAAQKPPQRKEGRARGKHLTDFPYERAQKALTARIPLAGRAGKA